MFDEFPRDEFYFTGNDVKTEKFLGLLSKGNVYIEDTNLPEVEGSTAHRILPNGREEIYVVESCKFQRGMDEIPNCYVLKLKKEREIKPTYRHQIIINESKGIQIGDNNTQNNIEHIIAGFEAAIRSIDNLSAPKSDKENLKALFGKILSNPTFAAIVGGSTSSLLNLLK